MSNDLVRIVILITGRLSRFQTNFFPWLNLPGHDALNEDPIWVLAQCAVASRHLDDATHPHAEHRLRKAAEDATFGQVFSPCPSLAAIQSLLVLSIWPLSREAPPEEIKDHRMQLTSAITMAQNRKSHGLGDGLETRLVSKKVAGGCFAYKFASVEDITRELGFCVSTLVHFAKANTHCDI